MTGGRNPVLRFKSCGEASCVFDFDQPDQIVWAQGNDEVRPVRPRAN